MSHRHFKYLRHEGLLNEHTNYSEIVSPKKDRVLVAFCSSRACVSKKRNFPYPKVRKSVHRDLWECPDCGFALEWRNIPSELLEKLKSIECGELKVTKKVRGNI